MHAHRPSNSRQSSTALDTEGLVPPSGAEDHLHSTGEPVLRRIGGGQQKVQQFKNARLGLPEPRQGPELIGEQNSRLPGIGDRVICTLPDQLVVLDQAVVRIFRESDG